MKGFVQDIELLAAENEDFRRVLYTAKYCQLEVMSQDAALLQVAHEVETTTIQMVDEAMIVS